VRRYWDGNAWTDSRVTTEGIPYNVPTTTKERVRPTSLILSAMLIIAGGFGLWFAETYKPSVANALGLNGNTFVLKPGAYHAILIVSIVLLVLGAIRLLTALSR
jgi:hypothetical protein